jgi:hypothetical protein
MDFATAVDRVRDDFTAMPGLEVTVPQAVRLWQLGVDDCRFVLDALVDAGFLRWTPRWTVMRSGPRAAAEPDAAYLPGQEHISVRVPVRRHKSV